MRAEKDALLAQLTALRGPRASAGGAGAGAGAAAKPPRARKIEDIDEEIQYVMPPRCVPVFVIVVPLCVVVTHRPRLPGRIPCPCSCLVSCVAGRGWLAGCTCLCCVYGAIICVSPRCVF